MNESNQTFAGMTRYRWVVCSMLFLATAINYMDRQVLSLTWKDFISPEFGWNDTDYGLITGCFSIVYAIAMLVVGKFIDKVGARRGYLWAIGLWSAGACLHAFCGIATNGLLGGEWLTGFEGARQNLSALQTAYGRCLRSVSGSFWLPVAYWPSGSRETSRQPLKSRRNTFRKKTVGLPPACSTAGHRLAPCSLLSSYLCWPDAGDGRCPSSWWVP